MHTVFINASFWISKVIWDWLWRCCPWYNWAKEQPSGPCWTEEWAEFANAPTLVIHSNEMTITVWEGSACFMLHRTSLKKTSIINKWLRLILCFQDDVSLNGYKKFLISQSSPAPLTAAEEELRQIKINEVLTMSSSMETGCGLPNILQGKSLSRVKKGKPENGKFEWMGIYISFSMSWDCRMMTAGVEVVWSCWICKASCLSQRPRNCRVQLLELWPLTCF